MSKGTDIKLTGAQEAAINEELRVLVGGFAGRYSRQHGLDMDAVNQVVKKFCQERFAAAYGWRPPENKT